MIHTHKSAAIAVISLVLLIQSNSAEEGMWHTDFAKAEQQAKKENKDLLIYFTRSDWCGWCIKFGKEVFSQDKFLNAVTAHFVLVKIDFPRRKQLSLKESKQNTLLREKYQPRKFPSVILCDTQGRPYANADYTKDGAAAYLKQLTTLQENKKNRDASLTKSKDMQGVEKARTLEHALSFVPNSALSFYEKEIDTIAESDPDDVSGFRTRYQIQKVSRELRQITNPIFSKRDFNGVCLKVNEYIQQQELKNEPLQAALLFKLSAQYLDKNYDEAIKTAESIISTNDVTRPGRYAAIIKKRIVRLRNEE